jgi:hypothetical protein
MRNSRIFGLGTYNRFSLIANCNRFRRGEQILLEWAWLDDLVDEAARQRKRVGPVGGERCYKNVTRKTGPAALNLVFVCICG